MDELINKITGSYEMIDAIRVRKHTNSTVEDLKTALGVSRTTADKMYSGLAESGIVRREDNKISIVGSCAYFLGISIGSANIRIVLLGLDFEPISREFLNKLHCLRNIETLPLFNPQESNEYSYAFKTMGDEPLSEPRNKMKAIQSTVGNIVEVFLNQAEDARNGGIPFPLVGIGFGVTGPVDYTKKMWISAPRMEMLGNISIQDLIKIENFQRIQKLGLFLSIDNNAKTSIVSEYQYLVEKHTGSYNEDLALIYIGSGIGSAAVIDRKLLRGRLNTSGELGHIYFRDDTGKETTIEQSMESKQDYEKLLPYALNILNCLLGIKRFILVGHSMFTYSDDAAEKTSNTMPNVRTKLVPMLMNNRLQFTVASTQQYSEAEEGRGTPCTAAFGAAIEAYFSMCGYENNLENSDRTNLAFDICWK